MAKELSDLVYGAVNTLSVEGDTSLVLTLLDPQADAEQVLRIFEGHLGDLFSAGDYTLLGPSDATLESAVATGRGFVKEFDKIADHAIPDRLPVSQLGPTARVDAQALVAGGFQPVAGPITLSLQPGELQQMVLRVTPKVANDQAAFLVRIDHYLDAARTKHIGGFPHLFTP